MSDGAFDADDWADDLRRLGEMTVVDGTSDPAIGKSVEPAQTIGSATDRRSLTAEDRARLEGIRARQHASARKRPRLRSPPHGAGAMKPNAATWPYSSWPERNVVRVDLSPMNPKIKIAQLDCGHDVYRQRKPRIGAVIVCEECARKADGR